MVLSICYHRPKRASPSSPGHSQLADSRLLDGAVDIKAKQHTQDVGGVTGPVELPSIASLGEKILALESG